MKIATGPGPRWLRKAVVVVAGLYFVALLKHPPQVPVIHPFGFFTEATCLFPEAGTYMLEYRLEGWSCPRQRWEPLDPRAYFPIEADDKESRFQRLGHFYQTSRPAMRALDEWIVARHAATDDAIEGPIGGIRVFKWIHPIPPPGTWVEPYVYRPLEPIPPSERKDLFYTKSKDRESRCGS